MNVTRSFSLACLLVSAAAAPAVAQPPPKVAAAFDAMTPATGLQRAKVRLLTRNQESWYARWMLLDTAARSLDVIYYIVADDIFGRALLGKLYQRAKDGVAVRLLVDARGSAAFSRKSKSQRILQELASLENVQVRVFNPMHRSLHKVFGDVRHLTSANHDKILLADGVRAVTGGRNISKAYFAHPDDYPHAYRDSDILVEGEGVGRRLGLAFTEEFNALNNYEVNQGWLDRWRDDETDLELARRVMDRWVSGRGLHSPGDLGFADELAALNDEVATMPKLTGYDAFSRDLWQGRQAYPVKVLDKHSFAGSRNDITPNMLALFDAAEDYILIQNPYVIMTGEVMAALKRASDRGVQIVIHTNSPESTNSAVTQAFFIRDWWKLLRDLPTLRIFVATGHHKMHAKVFVIDDEVTSVGSYNLDPMSQSINSEVMVAVKSSSFARRNRLRIYDDMKTAVEYTIRVDPAGRVHKVSGPSQHMEGLKKTLIEAISKLGFLRPLV